MERYQKALVSLLVTVVYGIFAALTDGHITSAEWIGVGTLALNTVGVYAVPNRPVNPAP